MERLGSLDAVFLSIEQPTSPMNIGSLAVFEGPVPPFDEVTAFVGAKLVLVPRCRQRIREGRRHVLRPVWEEARDFDLRRHVHQVTVLPADPTTPEALMERVMVRPLDRHHPLWEMFVVEGMADGRWAIASKMHHCMVDGVAGTDLLSVLLDRSPDAPAPSATWSPAPAPTPFERGRFRVVTTVASWWGHARRLTGAIAHPVRAWGRFGAFRAGARAMWLQPSRRDSPLIGPIGGRRRWRRTSIPLADVAVVRRRLGGTVNDAVLTAVAHGFRSLLQARGVSVDGRDVMALMPVSMRADTEHGRWDNRVAVTHALLPVCFENPLDTHDALCRHLAEVKASHMTDASTVLIHSGDWTPHALAAVIARGVVRGQQNLETIATNVPGPQEPLYLCGRRMLEMYPFAPIAGLIRIAVAIWSYCGVLFIGVTGDRDAVGDLDVLVAGIDDAFQRLLRGAA